MFFLFPCFTSYFRGGRLLYADNAYVGLALPGEAGSWQIESKVYLELASMKLILSWLGTKNGFEFYATDRAISSGLKLIQRVFS